MVTTIGIISDTHIPDRYDRIPDAVFEVFAGVDLILHAGDVGVLAVLDTLSQIAPVIAVHGNDESAEATAALPYLQTLMIAGHRVVLTHAHYPDRAEELASRTDDTWLPKLTRRADFGREHGAKIVVFGHTHIPMTYQLDEVLLINPGAIASGNLVTRQRIQTVAKLTLAPDQAPIVTHYDLATPNQPYVPPFDLEAGFKHAANHNYESIMAAELHPHIDALQKRLFPHATPEIIMALLALARQAWQGEITQIGASDIVAALTAIPELSPDVVAILREYAVFSPYFE